MRCRYCGSNIIHEDTLHENFSKGKAAAGAVMFGVVGAAAGFIGKDKKGYRCGACGAFMQEPMNFGTELSIDGAIEDAETRNQRALFDQYKKTYPNIQANIPQIILTHAPTKDAEKAAKAPRQAPLQIKVSGDFSSYSPVVPVYAESYSIVKKDQQDYLSLTVWNQSEKPIRSAYFTVEVYDDTADLIDTQSHVYQQQNTPPNEALPETELFPLNTNLASSVKISCEKIAFTDNSVWKKAESDTFYDLKKAPLLDDENCILPKYAIDCYGKYAKKKISNICYMPQQHEAFWTCICGCPVPNGKPCTKCLAAAEQVFPCVDADRLKEYRVKLISDAARRRTDALMKVKESAYIAANEALKNAKEPGDYAKAAAAFRQLKEYKNAAVLAQKADDGCKDAQYALAKSNMNAGTVKKYKSAIKILETIIDWKDAKEQITVCKQKIEEIKAKEKAPELERRRRAEERRIAYEEAAKKAEKKRKKIIAIATPIVIACIAFVILLTTVIIPKQKFNKALSLIDSGDYEAAYALLEEIGDNDSIASNKYDRALSLIDAGDYEAAYALLEEIGDNDSIASNKYDRALSLIDSGDYEAAYVLLEEIGDNETIASNKYDRALALIDAGDYEMAAMLFGALGDYKGAKAKSLALWDKIAARSTIGAGDDITVGLKSDGTVVAAGDNEDGQCNVSGWENVVAIAAGDDHTVGLKSDGTVVAAGSNGSGQCNISEWKDVLAIAAGAYHTVGLKSDGTVVAVGSNYHGQCNVSEWKDVVAIAAGRDHTVGLKSDGTVVAVGDNYDGQCKISEWKDIIAISTNLVHTVGLKSDGTVVAVGSNYRGRCNVSEWKDIVAIAAGVWHTVGLKSDGTVVAVGHNNDGQCNVSEWKDVLAVSAGSRHTVGLKSDGTVVAVGYNQYGQCNVSEWKKIRLPDSNR